MTAEPVSPMEYLAGLDYPLSKEDLLRHAQEVGADTELMQRLRSLPVEQFGSPAEVDAAFIGVT